MATLNQIITRRNRRLEGNLWKWVLLIWLAAAAILTLADASAFAGILAFLLSSYWSIILLTIVTMMTFWLMVKLFFHRHPRLLPAIIFSALALLLTLHLWSLESTLRYMRKTITFHNERTARPFLESRCLSSTKYKNLPFMAQAVQLKEAVKDGKLTLIGGDDDFKPRRFMERAGIDFTGRRAITDGQERQLRRLLKGVTGWRTIDIPAVYGGEKVHIPADDGGAGLLFVDEGNCYLFPRWYLSLTDIELEGGE